MYKSGTQGEGLSWRFKLQSHSVWVVLKAMSLDKSSEEESVGAVEVPGLTEPTSI